MHILHIHCILWSYIASSFDHANDIVQNAVKFEIFVCHTICSSIVKYTTTSIFIKDQTKIWFWGGTHSKQWKQISYVLIYMYNAFVFH
jgi:hypothetical protein